MAFDTSPEALAHHVSSSIEARQAFINETYYESVRRFTGPAYREGQGGPSDTDFENHAHSWLSNFLPRLCSGNPRVKSKTVRLHDFASAFAKAVELGVNRNFELTNVKRTIEQLATDWAFRYCVGFTSPAPQAGMEEREDPPMRPTTRRLALGDYIWDVLAQQHAEVEFQGHRVIRYKEDLLREGSAGGWNLKAIMALNEDSDKIHEQQRMKAPMQPRRGEVEYWEVLVHNHRLDKHYTKNGREFRPSEKKGFHGTIFTVSQFGGEELRRPRPFFGPRDGPYTFSSYLFVPDEVVGLSPLTATAAQAEALNAVMASVIRAIKDYKRGVAVGSEFNEAAEKMANFMDEGVFTLDNLQEVAKSIMPIEMGGLTNQHPQFVSMLRNLLERSSGITEAIQGQVSGDATATEASIAQQASGQRASYMAEKFISTVVGPIARKEAFYLTMDPRSRVSLGDQAKGLFIDPETGQPIEYPVLAGSPEHLSILEDLDIEIEPISMRYTSEMLEAEREAEWDNFVFTTAPMIPQMPYIDWESLYSRKAERLGDPSRAKTVNVKKAMALGMMQTAAQLGMMPNAQPAPSLSSSQPRLGIDVKRAEAPKLKSSEKPTAFTGNARPGGNGAQQQGQIRKGPRMAGETASTR